MSNLLHWFERRVGDAMDPVAVAGTEQEPLSALVARLRAAEASTAVIVDSGGAVIGLLDAESILRRVVFDVAAEQPVRTVLGGRPLLASVDEPLYLAVPRMRRHGSRQLVVIDAALHPLGLLRLEAALVQARPGALALVDRLPVGNDVADLAAIKAAQAEIAAALLAEHQPAAVILEVIATLNLDLVRRLTAAKVAALAADGWGEPPVPFAVIVMGSAGRGESLLHPDQDNGFILADHSAADHARIDGYFVELAGRLTRDLAAVGFPLCSGNVMPTNPLWRRSLAGWRDQTTAWVQSRSNEALLNVDIFFDFRPAYGASELAQALRSYVTATVRGNDPFLNQMAWRQREQASPIGLFGRLITGHDRQHPDTIDLKLNGSLPLVELVRLLALKVGIESTGTLARAAGLETAGMIDAADQEEIAEAFACLIDLLLRNQTDAARTGRQSINHVAPDALPRRQRQRLVEALRFIDAFRKRVVGEFLGGGTITGG